MGKEEKNSVVEQVMDELNEDLQSSAQFAEDFSPFDFDGEYTSAKNLDTLIHFKPQNISEEGKNNITPLEIEDDKPKVEKTADVYTKVAMPAIKKSKKRDSDQEDPQDPTKIVQNIKNKTPKIKYNTQKMNPLEEDLKNAYNITTNKGVPIKITLQQSENLKLAQERLVDLEREIENLRKENADLISASDIFKERLDKMIVQNDHLKKNYEDSREEFQDEKRVLMDTLSDQRIEIEKTTVKNKELEKKLFNNFQQIRVRERDLENRLELMKLDSQTLFREKDKYILELKRKMEIIKMDLESQKNRNNASEDKLGKYRDQSRRAIRGLQMALHILKGSDITEEQTQNNSEHDNEE